MRKFIIMFLTVAVVLAGCGNKSTLEKDSVAPKITLSGLDKVSYTLPEFETKPTLIFFWASWCGGCNAEAPELVKIHEEYKDQINIYGVNLTSRDSVEDAKAFVDKYGINFPILLDEDGEAAEAYYVRGTPTSYYLDTQGVTRDVTVGYPGPKSLHKKISEMLKFAEEDKYEE
jgi:cytochrome c biogenesis protein CcmG, thiol:disulfide interchange protein DsbE